MTSIRSTRCARREFHASAKVTHFPKLICGDDSLAAAVDYAGAAERQRLAEIEMASLVINDTSVDKRAVVEGLSSKLLKEKGEMARPTRFELVTPAFGARHFICK